MEGKGRIRDGVANELCMSQRHEVEVEVAAQYVTLASEEPPNACKCYEPGDESEFDCKSRCRMDMLKEMKNWKNPLCSYEKCVINLDNFTFTDQECSKKCLPDCVQTRYNLITTNKGNSSRPDITLITLFWSSFEYLQLQQDFDFIQLLIFISAMLSRKVTTKKIAIQPAGMAMTEKGKPSSTASLGALTNRNKFNAPPSAESTSSVPAMAVNDYNRKAGIRPAAEQRGFNKLPVA
uniref:Uncharacterized protein n=1 Tax=Ditylenchus dipsaci TaxID=166011 RepID=A0A915D0D2_9BILA